jgi:hypothetical protein
MAMNATFFHTEVFSSSSRFMPIASGERQDKTSTGVAAIQAILKY